LLCTDPSTVPLEEITPFDLGRLLWRSPYCLTDAERHPDVVFWRARYNAFAGAITAAIDQGEELTATRVREILRAADEQGSAAIDRVYERITPTQPGGHHTGVSAGRIERFTDRR